MNQNSTYQDNFEPTPTSKNWKTLIVVLSGTFMAVIDSTIVNVALPSIANNLHATSSDIEWIVSGYLLAFGLILVPAGRFGDRIGHKPIFLTGISLFTIASVVCGTAINPTELVIARVIQGLAAGLFGPSVQATIQLLFIGRARSRAFGILGTMIGVSSALGPILGGVILSLAGSALGWRLVFFVNLIIGAIAIPMAVVLIPNNRPKITHKLDPFGLALITVGLAAIFIPLIEGQSIGWPLWTYLSIAFGAIIFISLTKWEQFASRTGREPIVDPKLARQRPFSGGVAIAMAYFGAFSSLFIIISLIWQVGLGRSPLASGLTVAPFALGTLISGSISDKFSARLKRRVLTLAASMLATSVVSIALIFHSSNSNILSITLVIPLFIGGFGNGIFIAPNQDFLLRSIPRSQAGTAAGLLQTAQRIGSAFGVALTGTVFFTVLAGQLPHTKNGIISQDRYIHAGAIAFLVNIALVIAVLALITILPRNPEVSSTN
ncbi:MFS transporter [Acidithrix ferrooxidans]|uniref:Multidrug resistance protein Stp n=1 Tax=Acidithrix ferrooxidans TaxID=1280514 RepID=A0A0D8HHC9_9ACTN|nr:MFS transporter [Acidithrix ferrooxidans]KJF17192.1 multidrug resistance protein Stp [Acidithrix ferrooxidans]